MLREKDVMNEIKKSYKKVPMVLPISTSVCTPFMKYSDCGS